MPKEIPSLSKAPIVEAVFDIQCKIKAGFELNAIKDAATSSLLGDKYPTVKDQHFSTHQITQNGISINQGLRGYQFHSQDGKQIVQLRHDGYTFNRLAPYTSWEDLQPQVKKYWEVYQSLLPVEELSRLQDGNGWSSNAFHFRRRSELIVGEQCKAPTRSSVTSR